MKCPKPTQDVVLNIKNRQKAIDKIGYGPLNPNEENDKFWGKKADMWDVSVGSAKKQLCGNCAGFNRSKDMLDCIDKGMGEKDDSWDVIDAGQLGYCEPLDFKCAASRTCDAWIDGNAKKEEEKVTMLDAYFKKVDALLAELESKDAGVHNTYDIDMETKMRKVKDSSYWGRPVGTPITPGMKPEGPKSPIGRARAAAGRSGGDSGGSSAPTAKPKKRIKPAGSKPSKPAGSERSEIAGSTRSKPAGSTEDQERDSLTSEQRSIYDEATAAGAPHDDAMDAVVTTMGREKPNAPSPKKKIRPAKKPKESSSSEGPNTSVVDAKDFSVDGAAKQLKKIKKDGRKDATGTEVDPIDVGDDIELAHKLLSEGKHIRMKDERSVSTLLDKMHNMVKDAKEKGDKAPEYDLCKVSVPKTNLFCVESKGIPRTKMPQFKGTPVEGSFADTKKNDKGEGDVEPEFRELLKSLGIDTEMKTVKANELRASQDNLDGPKVVGMAQAMREGKIPDSPIFVTKDGYILDGHHRWAAKIAIDLDEGVTGDIEMPVEMIDAEIGYLIDLANGFTEIAGIKAKGLGAAAEGVKRLVINPDGTLCIPCMAE